MRKKLESSRISPLVGPRFGDVAPARGAGPGRAALSAEAQHQNDALRRLRTLRRKIGAAERARRHAAGRAAAIVETRRTRECESLQRRGARRHSGLAGGRADAWHSTAPRPRASERALSWRTSC